MLTLPDTVPQLVLRVALLKDERQPDVAGTDVPEEDTEGVHIHTVVVVTCEKLWGHVYRGAHYAA